MEFHKGNDFWKKRAKHGKDKLFTSPEALQEDIEGYYEYVIENPLIEIDFRGKEADEVRLPRMRPMTIQGLCLYLGVNSKYFNDFMDSIKGKTDEKSLAFAEVITRAREVIYEHKFTGAAAGFLNANIISRDLGLADKKELDGTLKLGKDLEEKFE